MAAPLVIAAGVVAAPPASAGPTSCDDPFCTPGIRPGVVLGAPCEDPTYFVFGTTDWGRLVFCGSPRRYEPRYFRSPPMRGVKELDDTCSMHENEVAQAPDGMFLTCVSRDGVPKWERGDI